MTNQPSNREASHGSNREQEGQRGLFTLEVGRKPGRVSPPSRIPKSRPDAQLPQASPFTTGPCKAKASSPSSPVANQHTDGTLGSFLSFVGLGFFSGASHPPQSLVSTVASLLLPWSRAIGSLEPAIFDDCVFFFFLRAVPSSPGRCVTQSTASSSLHFAPRKLSAPPALLLCSSTCAKQLHLSGSRAKLPTRPRLQQPVRPRREASRLFTSPQTANPDPPILAPSLFRSRVSTCYPRPPARAFESPHLPPLPATRHIASRLEAPVDRLTLSPHLDSHDHDLTH